MTNSYPRGYNKGVDVATNMVKLEVTNQPVSRWAHTAQLLVVLVVSVGVVAALVSNLGLSLGALSWSSVVELVAAAPWWAAPVGAAGALLVGVTMASYVGAPRGARLTYCDLRWPIIGIIGLSLAIDTPGGEPLVQEMFGTSTSTTTVLQPILGVATLLLLVWALRRRVALVRTARNTSDEAETCETCVPIFRGGH